jgi:hypothetical protein
MIDWKTRRRLYDVSLYLTMREAQAMFEFLGDVLAHPNADAGEEVSDHEHIGNPNRKDKLSLEVMTTRKLRTIPYSREVRRLCRGWKDERPVRTLKERKWKLASVRRRKSGSPTVARG